MALYAVYATAGGLISNIIEWDGSATLDLPAGYATVVATSAAIIGGTWNGSVFAPPGSPPADQAFAKGQELWIPAAALIPASSNGPARKVGYNATNLQAYEGLDFDPSTQQTAYFLWKPPLRWDRSAPTIKPVCFTASGSGGQYVVWGADLVATRNAAALDVAHGAGATALAPFSAGGSLIVGGTISPPLGGSPAKGDFVWVKVWRAAADANDTITVNATLLGLMLLWNSDAETDA